METVKQGCLALAMTIACSAPVFAQEAKSALLAKQLAAALDAGRLDSVAAKDPANPGVYIGALYLPGLQLLTIAAKYSVPELIDARLTKKEYRDVYVELNGAGDPATKVFIEDRGCNGLVAKQEENRGADSYEAWGKRTTFDSDWKKQKLSEEDYLKTFSEADQRYADILAALLAQLKKSS